MENLMNLKFEVLVKEMVKNIFRLNKEYVETRKKIRQIKFEICVYILLVIVLLSSIITQAKHNGILLLSKTWQIAFLSNCVKICIISLCITLIISIYMRIHPLKIEFKESLNLSELEQYGLDKYSNIYSIIARLNELGNLIQVMYQVTNAVYTMFWIALCKKHTDSKYSDIRKEFLDNEFVPKAFKKLFIDSEQELITYDYNNDDKLNILLNYMRYDKNILDFLELVMCEKMISYDDLPAFCKQKEDNKHEVTK